MAKASGVRPSELYGLDGIEAYALDSAVTRWGSAFESALSEATRGAKDDKAAQRAHQQVLRRWLPSERRYADPARR